MINIPTEFTFNEWLTLCNPNCILRITAINGAIYEGKNCGGLNYEMTLVGYDFNIAFKQNNKIKHE